MRERTPSADDTPKRAPPAPCREAASADVAGGSKTPNGPSSTPSSEHRMVASTHNLEDIGTSHPINDRQQQQQQQPPQQQEKHAHAYRSAQTAQDKRSRLSNVINNLRKKVPDPRSVDPTKKEEDDRNSVERNLETLEKYVMTVLNGVIKDEEEDDREVGRRKDVESMEKSDEVEKLVDEQEDEDSKGPRFEPSKPNESRTEAAVLLMEQVERSMDLARDTAKGSRHEDCDKQDERSKQLEDPASPATKRMDEKKDSHADVSQDENPASKGSSKESSSSQEALEEKKENRSLGTIIMERLSDHQILDDRACDKSKEEPREYNSENELRNICRELLNDLLNGINQLIDENQEETRGSECSVEEAAARTSQDFSKTSLHCSLPLDKVASVLQNCQTTESTAPPSPVPSSSSLSSSPSSQSLTKSPSKPPSPTVRHLCLYCDRKFLSISLRQRHTERVHQIGGGRRSERNSRKPSQNCQYCSDKCAESLEGLFQHMVGNHGDKYHACVQCSTRYLTREALAGHMSESHGANLERTAQLQDKLKDSTPCKDLGSQNPREKTETQSPKERRIEDTDAEHHRTDTSLLKPLSTMTKDSFSNPGSPEFDSSFYSSVSCNIRENLLHHLDGKLQTTSQSTSTTSSIVDSKQQPQQQPQQQQSFYEHNVTQIQFPIDISLTAATPVYTKEYTNEDYENSSEYAQKPGKSSRSHPRRVSFEKYNFPRKYDGKEQWTCSIKDLSKFDISTQLTLRKKQQLIKERVGLNRVHQNSVLSAAQTSDVVQTSIDCEQDVDAEQADGSGSIEEASAAGSNVDAGTIDQSSRCDPGKVPVDVSSDESMIGEQLQALKSTEFSIEFGNFLRLRKWDENVGEQAKTQEVVYAELTGEWSRPRIYICGACASRHVTLKEMEEHKATTHPNVWCSHLEFSGDQRELYKHLFLPGRSVPTAKARNAVLAEKVCTKCSKNCSTLPELHRHMLECAGDQAWLLGLFGNGKKKCKWRPFGSRSRRRRQRGMKRNIQNSQTPRVNVPREKQPTGPRVRPSDRESIQKMLANLPPKRATRKVLQDSTMRAQGRLRNVQTRSRPRIVGDNSQASRMSRNKAALRNKLLKNAKSIQRNRCRSDNISAIIESVVKNCNPESRRLVVENDEEIQSDEETKDSPDDTSRNENTEVEERIGKKMGRGPRVLGKKKNIRTKDHTMRNLEQTKREKGMGLKARAKLNARNSDSRTDPNEVTKLGTKGAKNLSKSSDKETDSSSTDAKASSLASKNKSPTQATPKKKRPVDPVYSLNASIKAKSQLRTQDGKFARNPNKEYPCGAHKSIFDILVTLGGRGLVKMLSKMDRQRESAMTRSKLRTGSRTRNNDGQTQKRTTRLSSDSDKMPTLEPAVSSGDEYVEASANDLPILSPVAPSSSVSEPKTLRGSAKSSSTRSLDTLENSTSPRKNTEDENSKVTEKGAIDGAQGKDGVQQEKPEKEEKRPGKGRRPKNIEQKDVQNVEVEVPLREATKGFWKEGKGKSRKMASAKTVNPEEDRKDDGKKGFLNPDDVTSKKESKQRKEEGAVKTLETRSTAKPKSEKFSDRLEDELKIQNVPFEVKKLIGSDSKEDLLTKLGLTSRDASSRRTLRQTTPRSTTMQVRNRTPKDVESEKILGLDSSSSLDSLKAPSKKDKLGLRRKSPRNSERKAIIEKDKISSREEKLILEEFSKVIKAPGRGRRSNSLSNDGRSSAASSTRVSSLERPKTERDNQSKSEVVVSGQSNEDEGTSKRQTRGSLLNTSDAEAQIKDTPREPSDAPLKKNTSLGKRRGRIKMSVETQDRKNTTEVVDKKSTSENKNSAETDKSDVHLSKTTEDVEGSSTLEATDKDSSIEVDEVDSKNSTTSSEEKDATGQSEEEGDNVGAMRKVVQKFNEAETTSEDTELVNLNLSHLQTETSNSIDSGKENTLETTVTVQKLKVGRPRKSWGSRRERTSKRSLSNVIGILTEGMNIPVEVQQSVVLTVQTTLDNVNPDGVLQSQAQQSSDGNVPTTRSMSLEGTEKSSENDSTNVEAATEGESDANDEIHSCAQKAESEEKQPTSDVTSTNLNDGVSETPSEQSSNVSGATPQSPTNDIILDLSRRKTKGKGSFLEKIVSKIAKQKDALLEGEVGSLLDTAADELTSILDEVSPAYAENAENGNSGETKNLGVDRKSKVNDHQGSTIKSPVVENRDERLATIGKTIEVEKTDARNVENPEHQDSLKESSIGTSQDSNRREQDESIDIRNHELNIASTEGESKAAFVKSGKEDDATASEALEIRKEDDSIIQDRIPSTENLDLPNGARTDSESVTNSSSIQPPFFSDDENNENSDKVDENALVDDAKTRWKSKKHSTEGSPKKKSKRKSAKLTENSMEYIVSKRLRLSDILIFIDKPEVPFEKESSDADQKLENEDPYLEADKAHPGKRKTLNDNGSETKDLSITKVKPLESSACGNEETDAAKTSEDSVDGAKKLKIDSEEQSKFQSKEDQTEVEEASDDREQTVHMSNVDDEKLSKKDEESRLSVPLRITGNKKSLTENTEQCHETSESQLKRSSKRRSLPEDQLCDQLPKNNSQTADSKDPFSSDELTCDTSRRRSSRTKTLIVECSKNDEATENGGGKTVDEQRENLDLSAEESAEKPTGETLPPMQTTILRVPEVPRMFEREPSVNQNSEDKVLNEEAAVDASCTSDLNQIPKLADTILIPKVPKKRGRKKKCLTNENLPSTDGSSPGNVSAINAENVETSKASGVDKTPSRKFTRSSRNLEVEDSTKNSSNTASSEIAASSIAQFKIPEVTEVLQHTKKRTSKRRSLAEDSSEVQSIPASSESDTSTSDTTDIKNSFPDKEQEDLAEHSNQKSASMDTQQTRSPKKTGREQTDNVERPNSSSSLDLVSSSKTRSSKKKQLSSEDLSGQDVLNHRAESVDNLSEASCASEFSYFRKKRFSKKKKGFVVPAEDVQTDTSITDSESVDTDKTSDRRQSLKRKAKKNISFIDAHFDLVDDFDVSMDAQHCAESNDTFTNRDRESEAKPIDEDKVKEDEVPNESSVDTSEANETDNLEEKIVPSEDSSMLDEQADGDSHQTHEEDFQTPKKRAAGNFVVVHTKTGEILIVEKRKKLTKEAARFFCDVCVTSFTRKSSLKKHNSSQSHLLQLAKSNKEKGSTECSENVALEDDEETGDSSWRNDSETTNDESKNRPDSAKMLEDSSGKDSSELEEDRSESVAENAQSKTSDSYDRYSMNPTESLIDPRVARQDSLEDELLDEEICKITENMSHDEYVLTDHVSPIPPESTSTPIKPSSKKVEETVKKKKTEKKKDKGKKKNLADEHLTLDTPEPVKPVTSMSNSDEVPSVSSNPQKIDSSMTQSLLVKNPSVNSSTQEVTKSVKDFPETLVNSLGEQHSTESSQASKLNENTKMQVEESTTTSASTRKIVERNEKPSLNPDDHKIKTPVNNEDCTALTVKAVYASGRDSKFTRDHDKTGDDASSVSQSAPICEEDRALCERFSLRFAVNKRNAEHPQESNAAACGKGLELNRSNVLERESADETRVAAHNSRNERDDRESFSNDVMEIESSDQRSGSKLDVELRADPSGIAKESTEQNARKNAQEDCIKPDHSDNQKCGSFEESVESASCKKLDGEATRASSQHSKSKKSKVRKQAEALENSAMETSAWTEDRSSRKSSKSKRNQSKREEMVEEILENSRVGSEESPVVEKQESSVRLEQKLQSTESVEGVEQNSECEDEYKSDRLEIVTDERQKVPRDLQTPKNSKDEASLEVPTEEAKEEVFVESSEREVERSENEEKVVESTAFVGVDDDEASSSSSLADKPLSELLSRVEGRSETNMEEEVAKSPDSPKVLSKSKLRRKSRVEEKNVTGFESDENSSESDASISIQKHSSTSFSKTHAEYQALSEEEDESAKEPRESVKTSKDPDRLENRTKADNVERKLSSESENSEDENVVESETYSSPYNKEAVPEASRPNDTESETANDHVDARPVSSPRKAHAIVDRQNLARKVAKVHRSGNKDSRHRSKGPRGRPKKPSPRTKINLSSDSDETDNENRIESQNKSKIVKSVFGRVFGGEKTDKVKEVLNDWVSKSEDDSEDSLTAANETNTSHRSKDHIDVKNQEQNKRRQPSLSAVSSVPRKRPGRKPKKSNVSPDQMKDKNLTSENHEHHRTGGKHQKPRSTSKTRRKHEAETVNNHLVLPSGPNESEAPNSRCRQSKKRAEERISRALEYEWEDGAPKNQKSTKHKDAFYELRNPKDSGYGSFNHGEEVRERIPCAVDLRNILTSELKKPRERIKSLVPKKNKKSTDSEDWSDLIIDTKEQKPSTEDANENDQEDAEELNTKDHAKEDDLANQQMCTVDLESGSSRSCSSLAASSVRNRSPSIDANSQTTHDTEVEEERDREEEVGIGSRRISPLFVCATPDSSVDGSSNSENDEEDNPRAVVNEESQKRSSSEFSGEKIVIRSPSSTHKTEVVTIAPTDAIEDNALDVPQDIEVAKPRQGKVLNFDEELFVECCSRLKATTENELRGAKKIKLDHIEAYNRKDDQQQGFRATRDRWRDVESQNSLGSLLESVNQLLGEEMYSTRERDYPKRAGRNLRSEHSSRSASPELSRADNLGYEDSLDVAFEHNNKLRDKIQQRMRESENLIASTFGQKTDVAGQHPKNDDEDALANSYGHLQEQGPLSGGNISNGYSDAVHVRNPMEHQKIHLDSSGFKSKMNSALGGLLDKALSNLLHSNGKHDQNGSTPMKVLAELACARAPTSTTTGDSGLREDRAPKSTIVCKETAQQPSPISSLPKDLQMKKPRNPIKELFERKKELNDRKQQEKAKGDAALRDLNAHRQRKTKKTRKRQEFPLIRRGEHGGMAEKKKRRDGQERKEDLASGRIKDVYDFDEEESQIEPNLGTVMSYRSRPEKGYEVSCLRTSKEVDVAGLMTKAIGDTLENGKTGDALGTRLESMIDRKFKELEKFAPKTKGALKAFQSEEQQRHVTTGPMDDFIERKQQRSKRSMEPSLKHSKLKKRNKNPRKKTRNAWYENDSSDEYRTAVKAEDIGVGISKSQRTCSKGKQNLFAELSTSSESEFEGDDEGGFEGKRQRRVKKSAKKMIDLEDIDQGHESGDKYDLENNEQVDDWEDQDLKGDNKNDIDNKKSESEMSDHPLVIDERKDMDEHRNSDEETENQYDRSYTLDDLYREDSSVADSEAEEATAAEAQITPEKSRTKSPNVPREKSTDQKADYLAENELIPLEEALDLLDQSDAALAEKYKTASKEPTDDDHANTITIAAPSIDDTFSQIEEPEEKCQSPVEEPEEEPDDDLLTLPEKLSSNEKPQKESENLPLHVFLSRKVQESKKRKEQQLKKLQEEQERILLDFQPTRRQRKCAIGKQGLLAEISSSDEEVCPKDTKRSGDKSDHEKPRKQKRESKEKRKERYIEKKHEQMIAKEQKAIEEEILRELGKKKETFEHNTSDTKLNSDSIRKQESTDSSEKPDQVEVQRKKHQVKEKPKKPSSTEDEDHAKSNDGGLSDLENNCNKSTHSFTSENSTSSPTKQKKHSKSPVRARKNSKAESKPAVVGRKSRNPNAEKAKNRATSANGKEGKERRSSSGKRDSDDEELKTTKSWNKVEEGVGVAIGRRKRAAANQLYYWSSSSDEEEMLEVVPAAEEEEDDRQEQHGWIVGDSHKRMITMLAMEKQLKEKRRRSEDEFEPGRTKNKKHRNSTS